MSQERADIVGTTGKDFTFTISSGTINSATLNAGTTRRALAVTQGRAVTVTNLPSGDSFVSLGMIWAPGDTDATVDVAPGGNAQVANPKPVIDLGDNPGTVELFGKAA